MAIILILLCIIIAITIITNNPVNKVCRLNLHTTTRRRAAVAGFVTELK